MIHVQYKTVFNREFAVAKHETKPVKDLLGKPELCQCELVSRPSRHISDEREQMSACTDLLFVDEERVLQRVFR